MATIEFLKNLEIVLGINFYYFDNYFDLIDSFNEFGNSLIGKNINFIYNLLITIVYSSLL